MNLTARRLTTDLRWKGADGRTYGAASGRNFGVVDSEGRWLSFGADGAPSAWDRKSTAAEIAATLTHNGPGFSFVTTWKA